MIIFPETDSYNDAHELAILDILFNRRVSICQRYMNKMKCSTYPLHFLLPTQSEDPDYKHYSLRHKTRDVVLYGDMKFCKTERTQYFFTLNIFSQYRL
jgi:hypothetical protein